MIIDQVSHCPTMSRKDSTGNLDIDIQFVNTRRSPYIKCCWLYIPIGQVQLPDNYPTLVMGINRMDIMPFGSPTPLRLRTPDRVDSSRLYPHST